MLIRCVQPACEPRQDELRVATSSVHAGASESRASGLSPSHLQLLTPASRSLPMLRIAQKHRPSSISPPSSSSHPLPAHLRNARIIRCGEHVKGSRGLRAGFSSHKCSSDVNTRCVEATRRSPRNTSSTLSVRRQDLRRFTRRSRRWYLLFSNALRDSSRVLTGT